MTKMMVGLCVICVHLPKLLLELCKMLRYCRQTYLIATTDFTNIVNDNT
jgi:hypothetical protein